MEPVLMLKTACSLLAIVALGGFTMAGMRIADKPRPPAWLAALHGLLAAAALTLLLYAYFTVGLPPLARSALLFLLVATAVGAVLNLNFHWKKLPLPLGLIMIHAAIAIVGIILLVTATWGRRAQ